LKRILDFDVTNCDLKAPIIKRGEYE